MRNIRLWPPPEGSGTQTRAWWESFWESSNFGPPSPGLLELYDRFVDGASTAADVGCGNGRYAVELALRGLTVTAVDFSVVALERARANAATAAVKVNTRCLDVAADSVVADVLFDVVLSSGLLEELSPSGRANALRHISTWTRPGGLTVLRYCLDIDGRGPLVPRGIVRAYYDNADWEILFAEERTQAKVSHGGFMACTGTLVARRRV